MNKRSNKGKNMNKKIFNHGIKKPCIHRPDGSGVFFVQVHEDVAGNIYADRVGIEGTPLFIGEGEYEFKERPGSFFIRIQYPSYERRKAGIEAKAILEPLHEVPFAIPLSELGFVFLDPRDQEKISARRLPCRLVKPAKSPDLKGDELINALIWDALISIFPNDWED